MTINYVPFLKLKSNEIMAVKELETELRQSMTPFFDFPYKKNRTEADLIRTANRIFGSISRNINDIPYFYLDNYDVDSDLIVDGSDNYAYLLNASEGLPVVPVISIDRRPEHMQAVCEAKDTGQLESDLIALRFGQEDFENYDIIADDIEEYLSDTIKKFENVDLVLDCRFCLNQDLDSLTSKIILFIQKFSEAYSVNRVIVTGSSIPASISDILSVHEEVEITRTELDVFESVYKEIGKNCEIALGDYGIISPNYSDVDIPPNVIFNVITAKIIYTFDKHHYIIRGGGIKTHKRGYQQYNDLAAIIVSKPFYRGANYSFGDNYIEEKSRSVGPNVTQNTILKPTINLHITYMLNGFIPALVS
ncbi:MAG: hypothetical protein WBC05_04860 [Sedimentisphaerales bacterium]